MNVLTNGDEMFDMLLDQLTQHADHLNSIDQPAKHEDVFYEIMSGALVWRDETNKNTPCEVNNALRFIVSYRTSLLLNEPRTEFKKIWDRASSLFPNWVGFRAERREPNPRLLGIYRRGKITTDKCLRDIELELEDSTEP